MESYVRIVERTTVVREERHAARVQLTEMTEKHRAAWDELLLMTAWLKRSEPSI
jgi:hypothetical protein